MLPVIAVTTIFILVPVIGTIITSLHKDVSYLPLQFVGLDNYIKIFSSSGFWSAAGFTILFSAAAVAIELILGLIFALLLNETFPGRGYLRAVVLIPWAIPTIISSRIWELMYQYTYGVINWLVVNIGLSDEKISWLGDAVSAFWGLVIADSWKMTPFVVIILLAGLQAIPEEIYKQSKIDGAKMLKRFYRMTLPLLRPVLTIALIFRTIDSFRVFGLIYVLTGGGPGGTTKSLSILGFEYFSNDQFGMGSAVSFITFIFAFLITLLYLKAGRFQEDLK
jgi:multiple sugar transport system permease protein